MSTFYFAYGLSQQASDNKDFHAQKYSKTCPHSLLWLALAQKLWLNAGAPK